MSSLKNLHLLQNFRAMKQYCQANDIVLALDNNTLYEAKVLRVQNVGGTCKYFIHYQGWHRKYDTWVDESLIAKKDDVAKQSAITAGVPAGDKATKGKKGTASKEVSVKDEPVEQTDTKQPEPVVEPAAQTKSAGKRKADPQEQELLRKHRRRLLQMDLVDEDDDVYVAKLPIPPQLKKHLTDEWKIITSQDRLLKLPKAGDQTVEHVVMAFLDQRVPKLEKDKVQISAYRGLMEGLLVHFDKALPTILLYRQERLQYDALSILNIKKTPSQLYGAEHLVRLFMRMPKLLSNVCLPASELNQILQKLGELLKFIAKEEYCSTKGYVSVEEAMADFPKDLTDGSIQNVEVFVPV